MKFNNTEEAKKWLRDILYTRKQLRLKIQFYQSLIEDIRASGYPTQPEDTKSANALNKIINANVYQEKIIQLQTELLRRTELFDKMLDSLSGEERCIMTAKYLNGIAWEHIEAHIPYCRRQAIRIHNKALNKLTDIDWEVKGNEQNSHEQAKACLAGARL